MNEDYFKNYLDEIKSKYNIEKTGEHSHYLLNPTRAKLRNLCIEKFTNGLTNNDLNKFNSFMSFEFSLNRINRIKDNTDKFRPIETFLKGETTLSDTSCAADMAAILVNFNPRPFTKYLEKNHKVIEEDGKKADTITDYINPKPIDKEKTPENPIPEVLPKTPTEDKKTIWFKTNGLKIASGCVIMAILFLGMYYFMKGEECMEWVNDHYEVVDCDVPNESGDRYISAKEEDSFIADFKKISPCDTLSFKDKNGNACLWYGKSLTGEMEFFNKLALHPETKKSLKEVSAHIFNTYIKDKPCE